MDALDPGGSSETESATRPQHRSHSRVVYSTLVNLAGIMHPLDENPAVSREPTQLPGFLFPSQVATLMLGETKDPSPLITFIVWPIFGAVMALGYPTQTLRVAASTSNWSILHFVRANESQRGGPTYQTVVRNFASLRHPMAYSMIKDRRQVEHNFVTIFRGSA